MKTRQNDKQREQFIGEMGIVLEQLGIPRMAGKIFGCLLISNKTEVPVGQLVLQLQASPGSVSTMTRLLIQMGLVDKLGRPGDRKDYFRIKPGTWTQILRAKMAQIIEFHDLIERGMTLVGSRDAIPYNRLREMHEVYSFFEREFPNLFDRWEQYQKQMSKK